MISMQLRYLRLFTEAYGASMATVLVAEDDPAILDLLVFTLEGSGHEVLTRTDGCGGDGPAVPADDRPRQHEPGGRAPPRLSDRTDRGEQGVPTAGGVRAST